MRSTDDACEVAAAEAPSGNVVFEVTNDGSQVTEFYLLADDGLRIIGEVENIGPGITRNLVVQAAPGSYFTACKPGMVGDGIRAAFTVTDSGTDVATGDVAELLAAGTEQYRLYVRDQVDTARGQDPAVRRAYKAGTTTKPARSTPTPACTGSASSPSPSRSVTSTPSSTSARQTSRTARRGPAGTRSRRTCGRRPRATPR